jgi:phage shock protein A
MGLFDRVGRLMKANINDLVSKAEDPEKILEQAILEMQENLVKMRQGVAQAIASQKRTEQQYNQNMVESNNWQKRAELALQKGDENLAREALVRKKSFQDTANALKQSLDTQTGQVDTLKRNLVQIESKLSEAKTKKEMLKARSRAAKAQEQLQGMIQGVNSTGAMAAFERMEEKVLMQEAKSQAAGEIAGSQLEQQFQLLEAHSDVDDELAQMKAMLAGGSQPTGALPPGQASSTPKPTAPVDEELEALRRQLNQ